MPAAFCQASYTDNLARSVWSFHGSAAASRGYLTRVIMVVLCVVSDINQARREVLWAVELSSSLLRWFGVCSCPVPLVREGVAFSQGVAYGNPSSRHSTQLQLCCLALGRGRLDCQGMKAITARGRNDTHCFAIRLCYHCHLVGCVLRWVATADTKWRVAWLSELLRGNCIRARLRKALGGRLSS